MQVASAVHQGKVLAGSRFVSREKRRGIVLFPIPCRSGGVRGTEWVVFGTSMSAIGSEGRSELWQPAGIVPHLEFESI